MKFLPLLLPFALVAPAVANPGAPFEVRPGDRVLLLGDTLLEREGSAAALEMRLTRHFAKVPFMVRNLAFSADLPTGVSRASFDPAPVGMERIRAQVALVKPTVAVLGYGMAASLEEITARSGDPNLNADPTRYGTDFSPAKFKADLAALMDVISQTSENPVRFVLLAPLRHEDLRRTRPGLPDPAAHNALLAGYTQVIRELATERGARFVDQAAVAQADAQQMLTDNGIHPSADGLERWAAAVADELGWTVSNTAPESPQLRKALQRKNELFFHRWRPANHTYIFGFRKREQGRNAVEIEQFDALLEKADAAIVTLRDGKQAPELPELPANNPAPSPNAAPAFTLDDGLEMTLWAENPLLSKPVEMNWDAKGRLWVASTPIYPQIQPGAYPTDKVLILEDTKHTGHADKGTLFADDLLIPTGVAPAPREDGCDSAFVGASTELLELTDTDGDGKADRRRVVLSGFGTEDTHHTIHSLHWGVDGRLYCSQSIYIHSHMETPWGVVRLNSGGVLAYDPRTERVEVFAKGLVNNWGHQSDADGQSFLTDGAGSTGLSWAFPGATFSPSEGAKGVMPGVSGGGYPKFCSLEIIRSPLFPAAWQGNAITNDFRAHRIVRFSIKDLNKSEPSKSAYATADQPDVVRTADQSFRPVDLKLGPDGALYVADWTNPVINHGEVDFRDPRRDKVSGRIWRIAHKDGTPVAWTPVFGRETADLLSALLSNNGWEQEQARQQLSLRLRKQGFETLEAWRKGKNTPEADLAAAFVRAGALGAEAAANGLHAQDVAGAAWEARWRGALGADAQNMRRLGELVKHSSPRVRVEALRALSRIPGSEASELVAEAAETPIKGDEQYNFALKLSMREAGRFWVKALVEGRWDWKGRETQLRDRLLALDTTEAAPALSAVLKNFNLPTDGSGPWTQLIGYAGGPEEARKLWEVLLQPGQSPTVITQGCEALIAAAIRGVRPTGDLKPLADFVARKENSVRVRSLTLAGHWKMEALAKEMGAAAAGDVPAQRTAGAEGLRLLGGEAAAKEARLLLGAERPTEVRLLALGILARTRAEEANTAAHDWLQHAVNKEEALSVWRALTGANPAATAAAAREWRAGLPALAREAGLAAARELGRRDGGLEQALSDKSAMASNPGKTLQAWVKLVQEQGDALKGERLYHSTKLNCVQCHMIGGAGGKFGPDMSTLGASAPLDYVIESVLVPSAKVKEGYHGVNYMLTDGASVTGIPFEENSEVIKVRLPGGVEFDVPKAKIKSSEVVGSLMPNGLTDALSEEEKTNLFAFLGSVGRPGAFDASNGGVARAWRITAKAEDAHAGRTPVSAPVAYTLTDGRLLPEHLEMALAAESAPKVYAVAKFGLGSSGTVQLQVEGSQSFWVDGKPAQNGSFAFEQGGEHTLVVALEKGALPPVLKATVGNARFLAR